jgi:hypothetical protein
MGNIIGIIDISFEHPEEKKQIRKFRVLQDDTKMRPIGIGRNGCTCVIWIVVMRRISGTDRWRRQACLHRIHLDHYLKYCTYSHFLVRGYFIYLWFIWRHRLVGQTIQCLVVNNDIHITWEEAVMIWVQVLTFGICLDELRKVSGK